MLLFLEYAVVAALVVWLSIKASNYIDLIDKTTKLSGAFLGGVLLSTVTSLPELFTSISATALLNKPGLCIGNILGSDLFNLMMLAVISIVCVKGFSKATVSRSQYIILLYLVLIYVAMWLHYAGILDFEFWTISITTLIITILYLLGLRHLSGESSECAQDKCVTNLTLRQIVTRFVLTSLGIIGASILMTYITDDIAEKYNLGAGLAGAIFLGVATSLPEVSSTIALFRIRNYDIAVGNIVGSNLFNFFILCIADVICINGNIYDFSDPKVVGLMEFGAVATVLMFGTLKFRKPWLKTVCSLGVVGCYIAFLLVR